MTSTSAHGSLDVDSGAGAATKTETETTSSRPRRSTRNRLQNTDSPPLKNIDSSQEGGRDGNRRNINSPTSTAKPSTETSPARKRSRRNSITHTNTNENTRDIETVILPGKKRGRGRPRKYPRPATSTPSPPSHPKPSEGPEDPKVTSDTQRISPNRKSTRTPRKRSLDIQDDNSLASAEGASNTNRQKNRNHNQHANTTDQNWKQTILLDLQRKVLQRSDRYGFFSRPVDPERDECPDYYEIVDPKDEMCFDVIGQMIRSGKLNSVDQYVKFVNRIIKCAITYNSDEDNFVRKQAEMIEQRAEGAIQFARDRWVEKEEREKKRILKMKMKAERLRAKQITANARERKSRSRSRSDSASSNYCEDDIYSDDDEYESIASSAHSIGSNYAEPRRALSRRSSSRRASSRRASPTRSSSRSSSSRLKKTDGNGATSRSRRLTKSQVVYIDDDNSIGSLSDSDRLPQKDKEDGDDDENLESGPIKGSEIPFCKQMLAGSIMSPCNTREEWLELCPKLATVCNEAARRSTLRRNNNAKRYEKPLSEVYMRERIEYDDPLEGFVVRTKAEPHHVQGFIIATRFTTWRKTFRWATDNPAALITPTDHRMHLTDRDCELTKELQQAVREGPDSAQGYKYPRICEISQLGGLGCGGPLLSRSLSELRQSQKYDYVVLQSTKIAIPFYEKHGFMRVGAVTRFNDVEGLPEVAYRHWSEIVNGEAVEASYMMARRLKTTRGDSVTNVARNKNQQVSEDERKQEICEALKSAYTLLSDALTIRIGSVAYTNSFREVLSAAREYAISADDYHLVKVIDKAQSEFTGSHFGKSKRILRSELRHGRSSVHDDFINDEQDEEEQMSIEAKDILPIAVEKSFEVADVGVRIVMNNDEGDFVDPMGALLPTDFLSRDDFFRVKVVVNGEQIGTESDEKPTLARLDRDHKSPNNLIEAGDLAVENLKSFLCKRSKSDIRVDHCGVGDEIMIRIDAFDGSPLWVNATVKRRCKMRSAPYYSGSNGFSVEWEDLEVLKREPRVLDIRNRGVGKAWCTAMDWASFSVLPVKILDSLLIGSKVRYPDLDGQTVDGMVTKRIGGGLENEVRFKVDIGRRSVKGRSYGGQEVYRHEFLCAGAIREAIHITDANILETRRLLKNSQSSKRPVIDDHQIQTDKNPKQNKKLKIQSAEAWADYRLEEYNLTQISENEKNTRKKRCNKIDDCIIHLSTGIGAKASKVTALPAGEVKEKEIQAEQYAPKSSSESESNPRGRKRKKACYEDDRLGTSEEKKEDQQVSKRRRKNAPKNDGDGAIRRRSTRSRVNILQF